MTHFKIYKDKSDCYRFILKIDDHFATLTSEPYTSMISCLKRIHFLKSEAYNECYFVKHQAECGSPYFTFQRTSNNELLATSETFLTLEAMNDVISLIQSKAELASVDDEIYAI